MKKLGILTAFAVVLGLAITVGCGQRGETTTTAAPVRAVSWAVIQQSTTPTPEWVNFGTWQTSTFNGEKVYMFVVEAEAATKEKAKIAVETARVETLARYIKELSTTMLASATAGMLNDSEDLDTYFEKTTAAVSKNVDTGGAIQTATYWEYGQVVDQANGTLKDVWRFVAQYAISKAKVDKAMQDAWTSTRASYPADLQNRVETTVPELSTASDAREGGN